MVEPFYYKVAIYLKKGSTPVISGKFPKIFRTAL